MGGTQAKMHPTIVRELGPYPATLKIDETQSMVFTSRCPGPFNLQNSKSRKTSKPTGKKVKRTKNKEELLIELKKKHKFEITKYLSMNEVTDIESKKGIKLKKTFPEMEIGWLGQPKGLLQVLYERGFIDTAQLSEYSENGRKHQLDDNNDVLPEYKKFVLRSLMEETTDFKNEPNAIQQLATDLSKQSMNGTKIEVIITPKYHCEIAGEGIEYDWGMAKRYYRNIPFIDKVTKDKFHKCVKQAMEYIYVKHARLFSGKARRYMLAYRNMKKCDLSYPNIQKFVHKVKSHRSVDDQDTAYLNKLWRESFL